MGDKVDNMVEEYKKKEKVKKIKKRLIIILIVILIIVAAFLSTVIVKKINISKLTNEYCQYKGEHPLATGMKETTHVMCKGCSTIMEFEYTVTDKLCEKCAEDLNRCKRCGGLLEN